MRRWLALTAGLTFLAWLAYGLSLRAGFAPRGPLPAGELRGAWHVHTTASDGRGSPGEVVRAAREAGLQFLVLTDHDVRVPEAPAWMDGVLVIPATEASTRWGHVVAIGTPRPLTRAEREGDPLAAIAALGGEAVLAHPRHPLRPWTGWGSPPASAGEPNPRAPFRGLEVVSNDTAWHDVLARRDVGRFLSGAVKLPFAGGRAVLALADDPADELALLDAALAATAPGPGTRPPLLFCSADAHGWPSYRAAFEAFSMRVPVRASGDAARDAAAVTAALLDGSAACVMDGLAPASGVGLRALPGRRLALELDTPAAGAAEVVLLSGGEAAARAPLGARGNDLCGPGGCAPGWYRVEVRRGGRPWIFTNPVRVE